MMMEADNAVVGVAETLRMLQENLQCVICLETLRDPVSTRCGHTFCQQCINRVVKVKNAVCPLCNAPANRRGIVNNEKIRNLVQAVHGMISGAQMDFAAMGHEGILQAPKNRRSSSKESFSLPDQNVISVTNAPKVKQAVSKRSLKVESWLMDMGPPAPTEESSPPLQAENSPNEDSDCEMVSVSQINPEQQSMSGVLSTRSKPLSGYIEEDDDAVEAKYDKRHSKSKYLAKSVATKKVGLTKVKHKQESLINFFGQAHQSSKASAGSVSATSITSATDVSGISVPAPVIVVFDGEKENTSNPLPARSPGWSRVQKMKKDFQKSCAVLRTVNTKGDHSPVPSIEDIGSGDEQPCLNLSLDSPVLKKKAKMNEIVTNLESEIEVFERLGQIKENPLKKTLHEPKLVENDQINQTSVDVSLRKPRVCFLKLGQLVAKKTPRVPFYLNGPLEHLNFNDVTVLPHRLFADAETQTSLEVLNGISLITYCEASKGLDFSKNTVSPTQTFKNVHCRKSDGVLSDTEMDLMDAETVLFSQPIVPALDGKEKTENNYTPSDKQSVVRGTEMMETEIIERASTLPADIEQSQKSVSIICSQDSEKSPAKSCVTPIEHHIPTQLSESLIFSQKGERNQNNISEFGSISQEDLDDSCFSGLDQKRSKRVKTLDISSDSSDSVIGISKKSPKKCKRKKNRVLSDNEDSSPNDLNISVVDKTEIMKNIEAQLGDVGMTQSPEWFCEARRKMEFMQKVAPTVETFHDCNDVLSQDICRTQSDSDGDSELINPTPQKQTTLMSRDITQSDDIVLSSQPLVTNQKPTVLMVSNPEDTSAREVSPDSLHVECQDLNDMTQEKNLIQGKLEKKETISTEMKSLDVSKPDSSSKLSNPSFPDDLSDVKPVFVCSSIAANLATLVEKLAIMLGGKFLPKFTAETTHLIVRVDDKNRADKTLKYLCAVASGKWVVSFAWVNKCLEAKKLVPEEPFEALDTSGEPGPRRSREARHIQKKLFSGFEFCCIGDFQDLSKIQLEDLLIESGATVVPKPTDFSFGDNIVPLTLAQWDEDKEVEYSTWLNQYCTPLVGHEWVLDCIGKFLVTSFSSLILCDATDDVLNSMGIPAYLFEYIESEL